MLKFNEKPYLSKAYFLDEAGKWLTKKDLEAISAADINDFYPKARDMDLVKEYKKFEKKLREEISSLRRKERRSLSVLKSLVLEGSPLDIEKRLLGLRWEFIEEKEQGHYFDIGFLGMYFLKLQVLERLFTFDKEKGTLIFDSLCEVKI